jgi:hypothetical protein
MVPTDASAREEDAYTLGVQAILWGYPMVCTARAAEAAVRTGAWGVNAFRRLPEADGTLDARGWLDLRDGPVVVHIPVLTERRWYGVQIGDAFDEVATNLGGAKGPRPGAFAVCGPRFAGALPGELTKVGLRTTQASCAARVSVGGEADLASAVGVQNGFHLMPLSAYLREGLAYRPREATLLPALADQAPPALRILDHIGQAMRWYLPVAADAADALVASFHRIGLSVGRGFDREPLDESTTRGLARACATAERIIEARWADHGETTNGWRYSTAGGHAGYDVALRAALAKHALGAPLASEVLEPTCEGDADGEALDGRHDYELHFPPGELPPVSAFWNMSLPGGTGIGSTTEGLATNPDGSLTIRIQHGRPEDALAGANWLSAPEGLFSLRMRFVGPGTSVRDGTYRLPAVTRRG